GLTLVGDDAGRVRWFALSQLGGGIGIQMPPLHGFPFYLQLDYALSYDYSSPSRLMHSIGLIAELAP
ncbi:MAG: hypothetical protein ABDH31_03985, partial [Chlorobiota bacterium]